MRPAPGTACCGRGGTVPVAGGHAILSQRVLSRSLAVNRTARYRGRVSRIPITAGKQGNTPKDTR